MRKQFVCVSVVLIVILCVGLTACKGKTAEPQESRLLPNSSLTVRAKADPQDKNYLFTAMSFEGIFTQTDNQEKITGYFLQLSPKLVESFRKGCTASETGKLYVFVGESCLLTVGAEDIADNGNIAIPQDTLLVQQLSN